MFDTEFCHVCYRPDLNIVYMKWENYCTGNDYRDPFYFALYLLKKHRTSPLIIDITSFFEVNEKDMEWTSQELIPLIAYTTCNQVIFINGTTNLLLNHLNMIVKEFAKYFIVYQCTTFEAAINILYD